MNRLSVSTLLKSVIGILAAAVMVSLALGAWDSWNRFVTINRITAVAETTGHLFKALHNLRYDRSNTNRDLLADKQFSGVSTLIKTARENEVAALKGALVALAAVEFADRQTAIADLSSRFNRLLALQDESAAALLKPKSERRADLAKAYMDETGGLLTALDKLSGQLNQLVKLQDSFIDQMMAFKQLAWIMRNASGDASLLVTNALAGLPIPADAMALYTGHVGKTEGAWAAFEDLVAGMSLPAGLKGSIETVKQEFFGRDYLELRTQILKAKIAGTDPGIAMEKWTPFTIAKLALVVNAAESALDAAKEHAATQRSAAIQSLFMQFGLLAIAIFFGGVMMLVVSHRVTGPLAKIQSVMLRLSQGDMSAAVSFAGRKDEIGALAETTDLFRNSLTEAARLRGEQDEAERRANAQRKAETQQLANEFEKAIGGIVETVSSAAHQLESAAGKLTQTADTTQQLTSVVASASEEASSNVQSVASAAEEMSASVAEISRQVHESSKIADEAVAQARKTDARIVELSGSASRIGDVVKLITEIAAQTNLLALNATIEAARAGEAGKGFAIVAQEVKALANQTAKATEEISTQISAMQTATQDSVTAIKEIGVTIGRISEIAGAIAAAVEEQGAATQEISRNVQEAARGTTQVANNIADVNRGAGDTGAASSQVLGSAKSLATESAQLKAQVAGFVDRVRAA